MDTWFAEQQTRLRDLSEIKRYLYPGIDWSSRCIGIQGARGVGKTTMMLQYLVQEYSGSDKGLYVSVDHPKFQAKSLFEFGQDFFSYGGKTLFLDEVHKYEGWAKHIKALYDSCPGLQIIFSGSSILQINDQDADLSRRAVVYSLPGLSFRALLFFECKESFPAISLEDLLHDHVRYSQEVNLRVRPLEHFLNYLRYGYYPFFMEGRDVYPLKLARVINQVLENDLPLARYVDSRQVGKLKKLLFFLFLNVPSEVNMQKLSSQTGISRPKVYEYIESLQSARLLNLIRGGERGYKILSKPDKIYLENPNLAYALCDDVNPGTLRESFFANQIVNTFGSFPAGPISTASQGDFFVKQKFVFEIGGKSKGKKQIKDLENGFVAADGIETGMGRKIPLWLFGFLY